MTALPRPLRFIAVILIFWTGMRIWMHYPWVSYTNNIQHIAKHTVHDTIETNISNKYLISKFVDSKIRVNPPFQPHRQRRAPATIVPQSILPGFAIQSGRRVLRPSPAAMEQQPASIAFIEYHNRLENQVRRLSGYGWLYLRSGKGTAFADGGILGGSQAGFRLNYAVTPQIALNLRVSTPLRSRHGREAAFGVRWKIYDALGIAITAERRFALNKGGRNDFAVIAETGVTIKNLPGNFTLSTYAQTGIIGHKKRDSFIDGSAIFMRPFIRKDMPSLSVGLGVWGAAQPDVSRLDIGPRLRTEFRIANMPMALSLDWRHRVAGAAAPQSGLALTLEKSF